MPHTNQLHPFDLRLHEWLSRVEAAQPCDSQQTAYDLIMGLWTQINLERGASKEFLQALRRRRFTPEHGWQGIGTDVAFADIHESISFRVHLHADGRVVIQSLENEALQILGMLPAALHETLIPTIHIPN